MYSKVTYLILSIRIFQPLKKFSKTGSFWNFTCLKFIFFPENSWNHLFSDKAFCCKIEIINHDFILWNIENKSCGRKKEDRKFSLEFYYEPSVSSTVEKEKRFQIIWIFIITSYQPFSFERLRRCSSWRNCKVMFQKLRHLFIGHPVCQFLNRMKAGWDQGICRNLDVQTNLTNMQRRLTMVLHLPISHKKSAIVS